MLEKELVVDLLASPNAELDQDHGQIPAKDRVPSVREVYAYIRRKESRRLVMMGNS